MPHNRLWHRLSTVLILAALTIPTVPALASGLPDDGPKNTRVHDGRQGHQKHENRGVTAVGQGRALAVVALVISGTPGAAGGALLAVRTENGAALTVTITLSTTLERRDGAPLALSAVHAGDHLIVVPVGGNEAVKTALASGATLVAVAVRDLSTQTLWLQAQALVVTAAPDGRSGTVTFVHANHHAMVASGTTISVTLALTATEVSTATADSAPAPAISSTASVSDTTSQDDDTAEPRLQPQRLLVPGQVVLLRGIYDAATRTLSEARIAHVWAAARGRGHAKDHGDAGAEGTAPPVTSPGHDDHGTKGHGEHGNKGHGEHGNKGQGQP